MVMREKIKYIAIIFAAAWIMLTGCAKVMPLTGGDEDQKPPQFKSAKPDTFALNFKGKTITIKFDEFINLVDPTREILISPPVDPAPEYIVNGQSVKIKFKDSLLSDVTYVINFGKSIEDITEANKNVGFTYVFSTGPFLDSGEVKGNIIDAFTGKPVENYKVMLYKPEVSDSFPYKQKPFYIAYTDKSGFFKLGNLRKGEYRIFALLEDNNNYIFDRSGEAISFLSNTVSTNDSVPLKMVAFVEEGGKIKFNKAKSVSPIRTDFFFSGKANQVNITPNFGFTDSSYFAYEYNKTEDTITLWHSPIVADSFSVFINETTLSDTIVLRTNKAAAQATGQNKRNRPPVAAAISLDANNNMKFDLYTAPTLSFAEPLQSIDTSKIILLADSVPQTFSLSSDSTSPRKYKLNFKALAKKKYILVCDSAAFIGLSGKASNKSTFSFGFREAMEYGSVKVVLGDSIIKFPKIWHLVKDDKVIRQTFALASRNEVQFSNLEPGSYSLRLIVDENGNKQWDTGKFLEDKQPERVLYMTEAIELKPGWDSEITWKMTSPKVRKKKP